MSQNLTDDIINESLGYITSKWIIERIPFIFGNNLEHYIIWKEKLSSLIEVDSKAIVFTGSSSVGFSLNPEKNLKAFSNHSDIDVAVVSSHFFDVSWMFLRNIGTKRFGLSQKEKNSVDDHRTRLIYWGTIATDRILQILPFGKQWIDASQKMSKEKPTEGREINLRIYKDFEALKAYHTTGLKIIKDKLISNNANIS